MRIRRSRGAADGVLLILLGLWGGFIPFVGQYFDYTIGPNATWDFTWGRLWLSILPAAAVFIGGVLLLTSALRATAVTGAWLALAGGIWFVVGQPVSFFWNHGVSQAGFPQGGSALRAFEEIGWYYGLGAVITALAAFALGRLAVRSVADARHEEELAAADAAATRRHRRFGREPLTAGTGPRAGTGAAAATPATTPGTGTTAGAAAPTGATTVHEPVTTTAAADRVEAAAEPAPRRRLFRR